MPDWRQLIRQSKELAKCAHKGQKRWGGEPYIIHPQAVAKKFDENIFPEAVIVSWLHDTVEDTDVTFEMLESLGFPKFILEAIDSVTKHEGESYLDFILRAKANNIGRAVKIADIKHNLSCDNGKMSKSMKDKYLLAKHILEHI